MKLISVVLLAAPTFGQLPAKDDSIRLFPQPTSYSPAPNAQDLLLTPSSFKITYDADSSDVLDYNINETIKNLFARTPSDEDGDTVDLEELQVEVVSSILNDKSYPNAEMDESYTITLSAPVATLTCNEVYGCVRGLETFSQLLQVSK